jgi:hypothetical protein
MAQAPPLYVSPTSPQVDASALARAFAGELAALRSQTSGANSTTPPQGAPPAPPNNPTANVAAAPQILLQNQTVPVPVNSVVADILQESMTLAETSGIPNASAVVNFIQSLAKQKASGRGVLI